MKEQGFQKAIERLISDENYSKSLIANPDNLKNDFGLSGKQILALRPTDKMIMTNSAIRAVSLCSCCTCALAKSPVESGEVIA